MAMVQYKYDPEKKLSEAQLKEIAELEKMPDDEIDFSDIPEMTKEDLGNAVCAKTICEGKFVTLSGKPAPRRLVEHVLRLQKGLGHITENQFNELYAKLPPE